MFEEQLASNSRATRAPRQTPGYPCGHPADATVSAALIRQYSFDNAGAGEPSVWPYRSKLTQSSVPVGPTVANDVEFCFHFQAASGSVLRRPIEIAAFTGRMKYYFKWTVTRPTRS